MWMQPLIVDAFPSAHVQPRRAFVWVALNLPVPDVGPPKSKTVEQDSRNEEMGQNLGLLVSSHLAGGSAPWPSRTMPIFPQGHSKIWQQPARGISIGNPSHLPIKVINLGSYIHILYIYVYITWHPILQSIDICCTVFSTTNVWITTHNLKSVQLR